MRQHTTRRLRFALPLVQGVAAAVLFVLGYRSTAAVLAAFAALLLLTGSLGGVDKTSPDYLTKVRWIFRAVGVGFVVLGGLNIAGLAGGNHGALTIVLDFTASILAFLAASKARPGVL